jgi:ABC-2 type transport system permease protein
MLANPYTKALWDGRRALLAWALAIAGVAGMYAAFWPMVDDPAMREAMEAYPQGVLEALNYDDLTSPAGYLGGSVYGLLGPLLLAVFVIAGGTRAVAGDEEAGTLDLVLAHPVSRARLALERVAAVFTGAVVLAVAVGLVMVALSGPVGFTEITVGEFAAMTLHMTLFGTTFGALAFAVGAAVGGRALTLAASAGGAVLAYLASGIIPQVEGLEWVRNLSPFHWYNGSDPLVNGVQPGHLLLLGATTALLVAAGVWGFQRRDIAT